MNQNTKNTEIQLAKDECCIIFDFGCYFPYKNVDVLKFDFSLGMKEFEDFKLNHRYSNKGYHTISKMYGKKTSKIGYPYIMKLTEQEPILLRVRVGTQDEYVTLIFALRTQMSAEKPICELALHYDFDKREFELISGTRNEDGSWVDCYWRNHAVENMRDFDTVLNAPRKADESVLIYDDFIIPLPLTREDYEAKLLLENL